LDRAGAVLPWGVIEMGLCERLHCLPSELSGEDVGAIIRDMNLLDLFRNLRKPTSELSSEANAQVGAALQLEIDYDRRTKH